ncbi:MAG: PpiC protein [Pseudomonadota bacterium]|nr:PpiC protein [Pseudomonadota bacterium]
MHPGFARKLYLPFLIAVLAAGCGDKKDEATTGQKSPAEAAARVNGIELTVNQVNYELKHIASDDAGQSQAARFQAVRNLVDQEVIAQKALADKLDLDSEVEQALGAARRQILAEAYMNRKLATPAGPSEAEVTEYFNAHPDLFAKRKVYRLQELSIKASPDRHAAIRAQLAASKTLNDFVEWLKAENLPMKAAQGVKAAEQLSEELLPKLAGMPNGQVVVMNSPDGLMLIVMADSQAQPVTLEQARSAIARMLQTQARQKAARDELNTLKAAARIEYLGEFVEAGKENPFAGNVAPAAGSAAGGKETSGAK